MVLTAMATWNLSATRAYGLHAASDNALFADTSTARQAFSVRASLGLLNGQAGEYVYDRGHTLSELLWDLSGLVMGGLQGSWRIGRHWSVNAGLWTALNRGDGEMTDTDWRLFGFDEWTDYSRSEVEVLTALAFDINIGFRLLTRRTFSLTAVAGYKQDEWEWTDSAQEFIYSEEGFRDVRGHFGGISAIDYEQSFRIPYVGLQADGSAGTRFHWQVYLLGSTLASAEARDHHILRELHFEDSFKELTFIALGIAAGFDLKERLRLSAELHAQHIPESPGDGIIVELDEPYPGGAGIAHDSAMLSLTLAWRF